jgi:hypothetical protein
VKYLQRDFIDPLAKSSSGSESSDGPKDLQTILGKRMVRLVRGRPVLQIFMMRSIQALNKSAPGPAELFTIQTQQNASVDLALSGLLNNSGLPISAAVLCRLVLCKKRLGSRFYLVKIPVLQLQLIEKICSSTCGRLRMFRMPSQPVSIILLVSRRSLEETATPRREVRPKTTAWGQAVSKLAVSKLEPARPRAGRFCLDAFNRRKDSTLRAFDPMRSCHVSDPGALRRLDRTVATRLAD